MKFDDYVGMFICLIVLVVILLIPFAIYHGHQMYNECLADGHKAYECHAMMNGRTVMVR